MFGGDKIVDLINIEIWEARAFGGIYKRKSSILKRTEGEETARVTKTNPTVDCRIVTTIHRNVF